MHCRYSSSISSPLSNDLRLRNSFINRKQRIRERYDVNEESLTRFYQNERSRRIFKDILSLYDDQIKQNTFRRNFQNNIYQACQIRMIYRKDSSSKSTKTDEIIIKQKINENHRSIIVYKGFLKKNERFSFKSQHILNYPFDVKFYVNGFLEIHFKDCCEYKYSRNQFRLSHSFTIEQIEKAIPCSKCQRRKNSSDENDDEIYEKRVKTSLHSTSSQLSDETHTDDQIDETKEIQVKQEHQMVQLDTQQSNEKVEQIDNDENKTETTNNTPGFFQSLLKYLQNGLIQMTIREPLPERYEGNVEDFIVILYGLKDQSNVINSFVNFIKTFDDIEELDLFVNSLILERILLISNENLKELTRFSSTYILSDNSLNELIEQMKKENSIDNELLRIEFLSSNQSFIYSELLKETLLRKDDEDDLKKQYFDYCRFHYKHNSIQMNLIEQLENDSSPKNLFSLFRKDSFLRKMINRALRTFEIDILYKNRWVLQILNEQIQENLLANHVYRIEYLSSAQFELFQQNLSDGLISFGNFLSCQINKPLSIELKNNFQTILFTIQSKTGFYLKEFDYSDSKYEILLSFDNIYHIESIEETKIDNENSYWNIHLISIDKEVNEEYKDLITKMRTKIESPVILIQFGKLLLANDDYLHADYFARLLFNDNSMKDNPTLLAALAAIHHLLGSVDNRRNDHRSARLQFEQSLKVFLNFIPEDHPMLSATYNNIGSMFYQDDEHEQAIIYHQKALQCQLKSSSPDIEAIATYSGNIGAVYLDQKKYEQALINYKRSLQLLQQLGESLSLAMIYDRLACIYWRMDRAEDALPNYEKALQLELKYLPENDHKISVSYFNLSTAYAKLNRLDEAINCAEKSIEQLLKSVPADHPEVKENREQLEGLRKKQWLQRLYD